MSKKNVELFYKEIEKNDNLSKELESLDDKDIVNFAKKQGFDFTAEELNNHEHNLSLEELANVSGGVGVNSYFEGFSGKISF